ncbi:hypothetical protein J3E69DRAFT_324038 [Trichoderma sp. SZMC 28015]
MHVFWEDACSFNTLPASVCIWYVLNIVYYKLYEAIPILLRCCAVIKAWSITTTAYRIAANPLL